MPTIDFQRSFLTFRIDSLKKPPTTASHEPPYSLNNARIQLECRCTVVEKQSRKEQTFLLGASCKTERVGVDGNIWTEPNADFVPIFSHDRFLNLKTFAREGMNVELYPPGTGKQSDRQSGSISEAFDDVRFDVTEVSADRLTTSDEIVTATLAGDPLVARTEFGNEKYLAVLEYPIKTMNANERDGVYQTDTGPVLHPDLECESDRLLEGMQLAFAAFNEPSWLELIVRVPTVVSEDIRVYHYSHAVRMDAKNSVWRIQ